MNIYKYSTDNYGESTLQTHLKANDPGFISVDTSPGILIRSESDEATVNAVMDAYLARDNILLAKQDKMWEAIKVERDRRSDDGGFYEPVSLKWFHSDTKSRSQQLGLIAAGASLPAGIMWKTMDGSFIEMTQTLAGNILAAALASDNAIYQAAEVHKAAMLLEADPETYDYLSSGWPLAYGE